MSFSDATEVITAVDISIGSVADKLADLAKEQAVTSALAELLWVLPNTDSFQCEWIRKRTMRYYISTLLVESADKFQYKKIYLQHRFDQYFKLLQLLDEEFLSAIENNPELFDTGTYGANFISYVTNGFNYDQFGVDQSYLNLEE